MAWLQIKLPTNNFIAANNGLIIKKRLNVMKMSRVRRKTEHFLNQAHNFENMPVNIRAWLLGKEQVL